MSAENRPLAQPEVQVLLATYNGAPFLEAQIESLLTQTYGNVSVLARDDGSSDNTATILLHYATAFPERFRIVPTDAPTRSAKANFQRLMAASSASYVALCDQDDVWLPNKVEVEMTAMHALERVHTPAVPLLVFSDLTVVNETLQQVHASFWAQQQIAPDHARNLARLLAQNVVTGCTALLNRALLELSLPMPHGVYMHDWWIALNACVFGQSTALRRSTVLYRQHEHNVVGVKDPELPKLVPRWRNHTKRRVHWEMRERQAEAMLQVHTAALPTRARRILQDYVRCGTSRSRMVRVCTWLRRGFFQTGFRTNLAMLWYLWDLAAARRSDRGAS